jgi:hypothetical protein
MHSPDAVHHRGGVLPFFTKDFGNFAVLHFERNLWRIFLLLDDNVDGIMDDILWRGVGHDDVEKLIEVVILLFVGKCAIDSHFFCCTSVGSIVWKICCAQV